MNTAIPQAELKIYRRLCSNFKLVLDVGSRDDLDMYQIHPDCNYHLFEPSANALLSLKEKLKNLSNHTIKLNEYGLSNERKENVVYYANIQSFTLNPWVQEHDLGDRYSLDLLDNYITSNNISHIDFLKIDVEGLDYNVLLGGKKTIIDNDMVSVLQLEYSGGIRQYVDFLTNFDVYIMMEPVLCRATHTMNFPPAVDFNKSLVKATDEVIDFMDKIVAPTGNGGNILCVNKSYSIDVSSLMFEIL